MKRYISFREALIIILLSVVLGAAVTFVQAQQMTFDEGAPLKGPMALRSPAPAALQVVLAANTAQQITIPTGYNTVLFSVTGGTDFWAQFNVATFTIPTVNGAVAGLMLDPLNIALPTGATTICLQSASTCTINMEFFR